MTVDSEDSGGYERCDSSISRIAVVSWSGTMTSSRSVTRPCRLMSRRAASFAKGRDNPGIELDLGRWALLDSGFRRLFPLMPERAQRGPLTRYPREPFICLPRAAARMWTGLITLAGDRQLRAGYPRHSFTDRRRGACGCKPVRRPVSSWPCGSMAGTISRFRAGASGLGNFRTGDSGLGDSGPAICGRVCVGGLARAAARGLLAD
jgi:hypothetical protein